MKQALLSIYLFLSISLLQAQIPAGYYDDAAGLSGENLRIALRDIITSGHTQNTYASLWDHFEITDKRIDGKVWDMYSDIPGGTPPYLFTFNSDQCGTYGTENDCYNREHSVPASWFDDGYPMYADLFHLVPTDGYVNNRRSNYPFGEVGSATWTSQNGSKLGNCNFTGYTGVVFEPIDSFKGDFARIYFYMATRYMNSIANWESSANTMFSTSNKNLSTYGKNLMLAWNQLDPVSAKEIARNNKVYSIQHNRNPYVDHPEWIIAVWDPQASVLNANQQLFTASVYPNPCNTNDKLLLDIFSESPENVSVTLVNVNGNIIKEYQNVNVNQTFTIDNQNLSSGIYFIIIKNDAIILRQKLIIN